MSIRKPGSLFLLLGPMVGCGDRVVGWPTQDDTAPTIDNIAPVVIWTTPPDGAVNVPASTALVAVFSELMDEASLGGATFSVSNEDGDVDGDVMASGTVVVFDPIVGLDPDKTYTAIISTKAQDLTGNDMEEPFEWSFDVVAQVDDVPPEVIHTNPDDLETDVDLGSPLEATFSEPMNPLTITGASFELTGPGSVAVPGNVTYDGPTQTGTFTPDDDLEANTTYLAVVTTDVTDLSGNPLGDDYVWTFTSDDGLGNTDLTAPYVIITDPQSLETGVPADTTVRATFNEAMDPLTITATSFSLTGPGLSVVTGVVSYNLLTQTAVFTPDADLEPGVVYAAVLSDTVADLAGNTMVGDYSWQFTSYTGIDGSAPYVIFTDPGNGETGVSADTALSATFNEPMTAASINGATFTVTGPGAVVVPGVVTYDAPTQTGSFTPLADLSLDATYTAVISATVNDTAGNPMATDYTWTFSSAPTLDGSSPWILDTDPDNLAVNVSPDTLINATFNEAMDASTLTGASFEVYGASGLIAGAVAYDSASQTATFDPASSLDADALYVATVRNTVTDSAGNPMLLDYEWSFTVENDVDLDPPDVLATNPAELATDVLVGASVSVTFDEAMDSTTITTSNFEITGGTALVTGAVTWSAGTNTATFNPTSDLQPNTTYTGRITTDVTDVAGNALVDDYVWSFSVATPPIVTVTSPDELETDVFENATIQATFNEPMNAASLSGASLTVESGGSPVAGTVVYDAPSQTLTFTPTSDMSANTSYTATVQDTATDSLGNAMVDDYVWSFSVATSPMVVATDPAELDTNVALGAEIMVTFSEPMDELSLAGSIEVTGGTAPVLGVTTYDAATLTATFTPFVDLEEGTIYSALVTLDAADEAGNTMLADYEWSFTTEAFLMAPLALGTLDDFAVASGGGLTNSNSSGSTIINGDVALYPNTTCLGDGSPCTITNPIINGTYYAADPGGVAEQAMDDLITAYNEAMARPSGTVASDLSGLTLAPGVYTSGSNMQIGVGSALTLDAGGDINAVWIFQVGSSLTINNSAQVLLSNGAQAKNVFWAVAASSTLGTNVSFQGSVLASGSNSVGTDSVIVGRLLSSTAAITLLSNTITLPPL